MSLIITVYVNEGIVMSSDSRLTDMSTGNYISDAYQKLFMCPNGAGISMCGAGCVDGRIMSKLVDEFVNSQISRQTKVSEIPDKLIKFFKKYTSVPESTFLIAGYELTSTALKRRIYRVYMKQKKIVPVDGDSMGAIWAGQASTLTKLFQDTAVCNEDGTYIDLPNDETPWHYYTLQEAIDFARDGIDITIKTLKYKNIAQTVGGPIDVLVIKPGESFWLQHKELH